MSKDRILARLDVLMTRVEEENDIPVDWVEIREHIDMLANLADVRESIDTLADLRREHIDKLSDWGEIREHIDTLADLISPLPADEHSNQQQLKGMIDG